MSDDTALQRQARQLMLRLKHLQNDFNKACIRAFPAGASARYVHGDRLRYVTVIDPGYGHSVRVRSESGREYVIGAYRLLEDVEP